MFGWWKSKSKPSSTHGLSEQTASDQNFADAVQFFSKSLQTVLKCEEAFKAQGLANEVKSLREVGAIFLLRASQLQLVTNPEDIPTRLSDVGSSAASFVAECDRLAEMTKNQDIALLMNGLVRAAGHVATTAEEEYRY